ncbi:MAG: zinc-dependent metalloprotease [Gemmatimonadaceae bacterium]
MTQLRVVFPAILLLSQVALGCATTKTAKPAPGGAVPAGSAQTGSGASSAGGAAAAPAKKTIASATKTSRKVDGLFSLYQDTANGSLHMVVKKDQLGKEFIYFMHVVDGVTSAGYFRGAFANNDVFSIRKNYNKIEFVTQNTAFYFDPASPLARAASANISPSVVSVQEIVAEDADSYLVKVDDIFLTEALAQVKPSPNPNARPGQDFNLGSLSKSKTRYVSVRNYPMNADVVVEYVYENPAPVNRGGSDITDARNVSISVQHSFIEMPSNGYTPRYDDARVGYFTAQNTDMLSASATPYRDMITRWKLVKKDPSAAVSEPVTPITWWIENTTPHELREPIRLAVLEWNKPFEAAGFRNAVVVNIQPDDADWDAGDIRYNVLRWTSSPNPPFGGYGPSFINPRTGEILGADIMLEYVFITNRLRQERLFNAAGLFAADEDEDVDARASHSLICSAGHYLHLNTMFGMQALEITGASEYDQREYIRQSIAYLTLHEVGHTLGLNHNMKSSQMLTPAQLSDRSVTSARGLTGSVMEYPLVNLGPNGAVVDYFQNTAGPYDYWAIEFGYSPELDDAARMSALLARSTEPDLAFGNDADDMRSPGKAIDPRVNTNDLSSDAIGYSSTRIDLANDLMRRLPTRFSAAGKSYHEMRSAFLILSGQQAGAADVVTRYIGGVYVDRAMVGQPGATKPFTPVSRADQKRAMQLLSSRIFAPGSFDAASGLYSYLQMQRRGFDHFGAPEDPKIHERALTIHRSLLNHLMHPRTLTRITDSRLYGNEYPLAEVMTDLTAAVFEADARGNVNTFRQNLQLDYVNRLIAMITPPTKAPFDYQSQSAALANLRSIQRLIGGKSGVNAETMAHTRHILFAIEKGLSTD